MVSLILLFIFVTPHWWSYHDKPSPIEGPAHPIVVSGADGQGMMVTVRASDVNVPPDATDAEVKKALRLAIEPVPVPVRLTVCGLPAALSVRVIEAARLPTALGVNVTVIVQLAPDATELLQVLF